MANPKCELNELCQAKGWAPPAYSVRMDGEPHMPEFTALLQVCNLTLKGAVAAKRVDAEQNVALLALAQLKGDGGKIEAQYRRVLPDGRRTRWFATEEEARMAQLPATRRSQRGR